MPSGFVMARVLYYIAVAIVVAAILKLSGVI